MNESATLVHRIIINWLYLGLRKSKVLFFPSRKC